MRNFAPLLSYMNKEIHIKSNFTSFIASKLSDYNQFLKIRLAALVVFSAAMGYLMAATSPFQWKELALLCLGGFLVVGASNGINQIIERNSDKLMTRTNKRPVATGRMKLTESSLLALTTGVLGVYILSHFNSLTAILATFSLLSYAFAYTPLKKIHPIAVFIGAIPGALPVLIGYAAASNTINAEAILLFMVQFIWQFPHFWTIAWQLHADYNKAGIRLLPQGETPNKSTAFHILCYTATLIPLGLALTVYQYTGWIAGAVSTLSAIYFTFLAVKLYKECSNEAARKLMFASLIYLPVVQIIFVIDKI